MSRRDASVVYEVVDDDARVLGTMFPDPVARDVRAWVHRTPLTRCGVAADTCEDWQVAEEVIGVVVRALELDGYEIVKQ